MGSWNWRSSRFSADSCVSVGRALGPYVSRRADASSAVRPFSELPSASSTSSGPVACGSATRAWSLRSEGHTSELQSRGHLVCGLLLEKKKTQLFQTHIRLNYIHL